MREETYADDGQAAQAATGALLRVAAAAAQRAGLAPILAQMEGQQSPFLYPPPPPPSPTGASVPTLGHTQVGQRLKGWPRDGCDWQLRDAMRAPSAMHVDAADVKHNVKIGPHLFLFTGALMYAGITGLTSAAGLPTTVHEVGETRRY